MCPCCRRNPHACSRTLSSLDPYSPIWISGKCRYSWEEWIPYSCYGIFYGMSFDCQMYGIWSCSYGLEIGVCNSRPQQIGVEVESGKVSGVVPQFKSIVDRSSALSDVRSLGALIILPLHTQSCQDIPLGSLSWHCYQILSPSWRNSPLSRDLQMVLSGQWFLFHWIYNAYPIINPAIIDRWIDNGVPHINRD